MCVDMCWHSLEIGWFMLQMWWLPWMKTCMIKNVFGIYGYWVNKCNYLTTLKHTSTINKCSPMGPGNYPVPIYIYIHTYSWTFLAVPDALLRIPGLNGRGTQGHLCRNAMQLKNHLEDRSGGPSLLLGELIHFLAPKRMPKNSTNLVLFK